MYTVDLASVLSDSSNNCFANKLVSNLLFDPMNVLKMSVENLHFRIQDTVEQIAENSIGLPLIKLNQILFDLSLP